MSTLYPEKGSGKGSQVVDIANLTNSLSQAEHKLNQLEVQYVFANTNYASLQATRKKETSYVQKAIDLLKSLDTSATQKFKSEPVPSNRPETKEVADILLHVSEIPAENRTSLVQNVRETFSMLLKKIELEAEQDLQSMTELKAEVTQQKLAISSLKEQIRNARNPTGANPSELASIVASMQKDIREYVGGQAPPAPKSKVSLDALLKTVDINVQNERTDLLGLIKAAQEDLRTRSDTLASTEAHAGLSVALKVDKRLESARDLLDRLKTGFSEVGKGRGKVRTTLRRLSDFFVSRAKGAKKTADLSALLKILESSTDLDVKKCNGVPDCILPMIKDLDSKVKMSYASLKEAVDAQSRVVDSLKTVTTGSTESSSVGAVSSAERDLVSKAQHKVDSLRSQYDEREIGWKKELALVDNLTAKLQRFRILRKSVARS